jgi:hypothetical protein
MPSVTIVWKGSCSDPRVRYRLLGYLGQLAARSDEYLNHARPKRPVLLKATSQRRGEALRTRPNVEIFDNEMSGSILLSSWISQNPETLASKAREAGVKLVTDPEAKGRL